MIKVSFSLNTASTSEVVKNWTRRVLFPPSQNPTISSSQLPPTFSRPKQALPSLSLSPSRLIKYAGAPHPHSHTRDGHSPALSPPGPSAVKRECVRLAKARALAMASVLVALLLAQSASAATLALYNRCPETVWPGIQPSAGKELLARGGLQLAPNRATSIRLPPGWSGRVWGRQGCKFDAAGRGRCATGDCGGTLYCNGAGGAPPATLAEITLAAVPSAQDFYDVSLVDGYNIPIAMTPYHGKGANCLPAGCVSDLNRVCPAGLAVRDGKIVVGCRSACAAYGSPQYCCTGQFGGPQQCKPTAYSRLFKSACPKAYSYAYDDPTSILTCSAGASYVVTFCPHHR